MDRVEFYLNYWNCHAYVYRSDALDSRAPDIIYSSGNIKFILSGHTLSVRSVFFAIDSPGNIGKTSFESNGDYAIAFLFAFLPPL